MWGCGEAEREMGKTATALSGAERAARAGERLAEARGQLAEIQGRLAQAQGALDALARLEASAQAHVTGAERAADEAAAAIVDARAGALVAAGSADEASAEAAHTAAQEAHSAARSRLDEARALLEATRAKVQAEGATLREQMQADDEKRRELARLISSLERNQKAAHADAGRERLMVARERHQALQARLAEHHQGLADIQADLDAHHSEVAAILAEHPTLAGSREHAEASDPHRALKEILRAYGGYLETLTRWYKHPDKASMEFSAPQLARMLSNNYLSDFSVLHGIVTQNPGASAGFAYSMQKDIREELAGLDAGRARRIEKLSSVTPAQAE